jgi:hypothetical protein
VRRRLLVRMFRLARRHARPAYFDIGDPTLELPRGALGAGATPAGGLAAPPGQPVRAGSALPLVPPVPAVSGATDQTTGA